MLDTVTFPAYYAPVDSTVTAFAKYLQPLRAANTVEVYVRSATKFQRFLHEQGWDLDNFPVGVLSEFASSLSRTLRPRSVHTFVYGVKQFLQWARKRGIAVPLYDEASLPRVKEDIPLILSEAALASYLEVCRSVDEPFSSAMRLLGLSTLRVMELCKLRTEDVTPTPYGVLLRIVESSSKGDCRNVPTPREFKGELTAYLRGYRAAVDSLWLFPDPHDSDTHIRPSQLRKRFRRVREKLGLSGFTPHTLRRTWLTIMHQHGVSPLTLARIAGHKNLSTTRFYVIPSENELFGAVNKPRMHNLRGDANA